MEDLIIYSPQGIPNKESYLNEELKKINKRKICSITKKENGDIKILLDENTKKGTYFVKSVKKTERNYFDIISFLEKNENDTKFAQMIKYVEYETFFIVFFKKE